MTVRNPTVRLLHMLEYSKKAIALVEKETRASLNTDEKLFLALTRLVELIGEAASHVPLEIQEKYPEIAWIKIVNIRHRLIHGYDSVDHDILWDTITLNLPELARQLESILQDSQIQ